MGGDALSSALALRGESAGALPMESAKDDGGTGTGADDETITGANDDVTGADDDVTGAKEEEAAEADALKALADDTVGDTGGVLVDTIWLCTLLMGEGRALTDRVDIAVGDMTRFRGFGCSTVALDGRGTVADRTTEFNVVDVAAKF